MTQRPSTYALSGGLDEISPALTIPRGRAISALNYESAPAGYSRILGYERFDGRTSPTDAYAMAEADEETADRDAARAAIQKPAGSGAIRGVATYNGNVYCWRDNAGGTAGVMFRATSGGWVAVNLGHSLDFTSGSTTIEEGQTITGATSGATALVKRVVTTAGSWTAGDMAGYLVLANIVGTFVAEDLNIGASANVATIAGAPVAQTFPPGGRYYTQNHNFYGASDLKEMYGCNGVGRGFAFDGDSIVFIRTGMPVDVPLRLRVHKKHLFFAFAGGSVQHSETGEPLQWNAVFGAGEIALGSDITDLIATVDALFMMTEDQINYLTGSDATDWVMVPLNNEDGHGAIAHTVQNIGSPTYLDIGGFRSISTTQGYGNFKIGTLAPQIEPTLTQKRKLGVRPIASIVAKGRDQYRLFFDDGSGISLYFGRKYPEPMLFEFPTIMRCMCVELEGDTGERIFAGGNDGYVYELDRGTSFDGAEIAAYLQLAWDTEGSPDVLKRWHKVIIEMDAAPDTQVGMIVEFDYGDGEQGTLPEQDFTVSGGGGLWNLVDWNSFYWSSPAKGKAEAYVDGQGENMSIVLVSVSADQAPHTFSVVRKKFSVRGAKR